MLGLRYMVMRLGSSVRQQAQVGCDAVHVTHLYRTRSTLSIYLKLSSSKVATTMSKDLQDAMYFLH
jgi:hypothetical protein